MFSAVPSSTLTFEAGALDVPFSFDLNAITLDVGVVVNFPHGMSHKVAVPTQVVATGDEENCDFPESVFLAGYPKFNDFGFFYFSIYMPTRSLIQT